MAPNLVFASGVLIPQRIAGLDYFNGLRSQYPPATTLFPPVSVLGSVQLRAQELAERINLKFPAGEIHIIAHSMGGLDARCMLAQNMLGLAAAGRIISLSTISTPHKGSPVANLLLGEPDGLDFPFNNLLAQFASVNVHAIVDLTTTGAPGFKDKDPVPGIRYFAYAGAGLGSPLLFATQVYIQTREGANDGMVSVKSATWPNQLAEPAWDADHFGEVGYALNVPDLTTSFPFLATIARVVQRATS
jgi:triacylglycerol lipase